MSNEDLYITACENLDMPVSIAQKQGLKLDDLLLLLERDYNEEMQYYEPEIND